MRLTPLCFDSFESFTEWLWHARNTKPLEEWNYCADCLPEYKKKMIDKGRCYHPETYFMVKLKSDGIERSGELIGVACHDGDYVNHSDKRFARTLRGRTFTSTEDGERMLSEWCAK